MGTRAMITVDGKPFVATHWDGYPESLGKDLKSAKTKKDIVSVADKHGIDYANLESSEFKKIREERFKKISERTKGKYSVADLKRLEKEGKSITFTVQTPQDYPVGSIVGYDDYAEYQYDFDTKTGTWKVRAVDGSWKEQKPKKWEALEKVMMREKKKLSKVTA